MAKRPNQPDPAPPTPPAAPVHAAPDPGLPVEQVFQGLPVSPGIVIGTVRVVEGDEPQVPRRAIKPGEAAEEAARFRKAVGSAVQELQAVYERARKEMGDETAGIFRSHITILQDNSVAREVVRRIEGDLVTADYAVFAVLSELAAKFRAMRDEAFSTKVNDVEDILRRLHRHLQGEQFVSLAQAEPDTVVVARDLTPSQTAGFDRERIRAFVTDLGGLTSHTAIIAKALEIPAVVGVRTMLRSVRDGQMVVVDGDTGRVVVNPTPETIGDYQRAIEQRRLFRVSLAEVADLPPVTHDGVAISLLGNIELPDEAEKVFRMGGGGIGLYRTEYLYLTRPHEPTEEDHFAAYKRCVELCRGRELNIRTVDLGADKLTQSREETPERNPFLGNRSIRYCLRNVPMFKRQLRAILRASALGPIKIMFPLVSAVAELRQAKFILRDVMEECLEDGIPFDPKIPVGMMVEVPSAALQADAFARECDFFSIGTNDLTQYTLAVDRINERVAHLYQPTHPAVLKLVRDTARSGRRHRISVSCCGEAAGDVEYAMLLIGMGLRTLSVSAQALPRLKRFIRSVTIEQCERVARQVFSLDSDVQVTAYIRDRARKVVPEAFSGRSVE